MNGFVKVRLLNLLKKATVIPQKEAEFSDNENVLILSPHFDDDVISCFGALWKHKQHNAEVDIIYIADGSASLNSGLENHELPKVREKEAELAINTFFDNSRLFKLNKKDGHVKVSDQNVDWLCELILDKQYKYIYSPHISDTHSDHKETFSFLKRAIEKSHYKCAVRFYEFWMPLKNPNIYVDICDCEKEKDASVSFHKSQLAFIDYVELAKIVNSYRGTQAGVKICEAYREIESIQIFCEEIECDGR